MKAEEQLRGLISERKKVFLDEIRQLPEPKRKFYLDLTQRALQEIVLDNDFGRLTL